MKFRMVRGAFVVAGLAAAGGLGIGSAFADTLSFDAGVTPGIIFGTGNSNGGFTVKTTTTGDGNHVEIGLRGKLRFDTSDHNLPKDVFNSNGDGTYSFDTGGPTTTENVPGYFNLPDTPRWSFDWSVNVDATNLGGFKLDKYTYKLRLDSDPTLGTDFYTFDPIIVSSAPVPDNSMGNNSTTQADDDVASSSDYSGYVNFLTQDLVAQNSWNYEFFSGGLNGFNRDANGRYTISLTAYDSSNQAVATNSIDIIVGSGAPATVPIPGAMLLFASGLGALGYTGRRKMKRSLKTEHP